MVKLKKGQASAAAALIALIAGFLVLYILLLPPSERAKVLEGDNQTSPSNGGPQPPAPEIKERDLLDVEPGRIEYLASARKEHRIPEVHIFTKVEGTIFTKKESLYIKRSLFSSRVENISFIIDDKDNLKSLSLSGLVKKGKGRISINLNGNEIYNGDVGYGNIGPIDVPMHLVHYNNEIVISVSSPSFAFWDSNEYELEDLMIFGDVKFTGSKEAERSFLVSKQEIENLDSARFYYIAYCEKTLKDKVDIKINGKEIYSGIPSCGRRQEMGLPVDLLEEDNTISFALREGDVKFSQMFIETHLKKISYPVYFFELSKEEDEAIRRDRKRVLLDIRMSEAVKEKRGYVQVNRRRYSFDTSMAMSRIDVSEAVIKGENSVTIVPNGVSIEVHNLNVKLVK